MMAAVGAIIASAAAGAAAPDAGAAKRLPVIDSISPRNVAIGQTLSIRGRHFIPGRYKNTVVFKRDGNRAVFVKADVGTRKLIRVTVPARLKELLLVRDGGQIATPFRLRILAKRLGKSFTTGNRVPLVGPELPPAPEAPPESAADGDCDLDKVLNRDDADDDNDLLPDAQEASLGTDGCKSDSDEDGVTDGYEYQSAIDLNDDEYQEPQSILPAPIRKPYPNPLFADANVDYDGDSLKLGQEFALWKAYRNPAAGLSDLVYSDGNQYSAYGRDGADRRPGPLVGADPNVKHTEFLAWAAGNGYASVMVRGVLYSLTDMNRDGVVAPAPIGNYLLSETRYFDFDFDGKLSDDERDEDADGLTNYDEATGRMTPQYWVGCYKKEKPFPISFAATDLVDPDSDGDGVRDGADDQDHDDVPNVMELSRNAATGRALIVSCGADKNPTDPNPIHGVVNPYNPCVPYVDSRTCERHPSLDTPYFPFDAEAPFYQVLN
ncbi:MAG TPA: IPT/TIG domain-containing protein [Solirubrobacteraceae bacterium]|jgi:hypothetical protein|nr:IPT/TIG domain-containing protein [Solirubrobacteraceae bacterium]